MKRLREQNGWSRQVLATKLDCSIGEIAICEQKGVLPSARTPLLDRFRTLARKHGIDVP
jgi:ribosome-binding protein aMBF1 (putative translation factor)